MLICNIEFLNVSQLKIILLNIFGKLNNRFTSIHFIVF